MWVTSLLCFVHKTAIVILFISRTIVGSILIMQAFFDKGHIYFSYKCSGDLSTFLYSTPTRHIFHPSNILAPARYSSMRYTAPLAMVLLVNRQTKRNQSCFFPYQATHIAFSLG